MTFKYRIGYLVISSNVALDLPRARAIARTDGSVKVRRYSRQKSIDFVIRQNCLTVRAPLSAGASNIDFFVRYHALPYLLAQLKMWVLHASGIVRGDQAIVFCGRSGSGKSTLAYQLSRRGYKFLSDEAVILVVKKRGAPQLYSYSQHPRLKAKVPKSKSLVYNNKVLRTDVAIIKGAKKLRVQKIFFLKRVKVGETCSEDLSLGDLLKLIFTNSYRAKNLDKKINLAMLDGAMGLLNRNLASQLNIRHSTRTADKVGEIIRGLKKEQGLRVRGAG